MVATFLRPAEAEAEVYTNIESPLLLLLLLQLLLLLLLLLLRLLLLQLLPNLTLPELLPEASAKADLSAKAEAGV